MRAADERPGPRKQCFLPDQEPSGRLTFAFDSIRPRGSSSNSSSNWRQTASDNRTFVRFISQFHARGDVHGIAPDVAECPRRPRRPARTLCRYFCPKYISQ